MPTDNIDPQEFALLIEELVKQQQLPPQTQAGQRDEDLAIGSQEQLSPEQLKMILDALMQPRAAVPSNP